MAADFDYDYTRADWVSPAEPVRGPAPFPWSTADRIAVHYTAALNLIDGDPGENWAGIPAYLRAIHHDYLTSPDRGYSIGYGIAVDQRGCTWQLRGVTWKNAANLYWNHRTLAVLCLVDGGDALRPAAVDALRRIVAWFRSRSPYGGGVQIVGHRDIGATTCPGGGIYAQIRAGTFEPQDNPPPPEDDMAEIRRVEGSTATLLIAGNTASWIKSGDAIGALDRDGLAVDHSQDPGKDVSVESLKGLTLLGPVGAYSTEPGRTLEITAGHFAAQLL